MTDFTTLRLDLAHRVAVLWLAREKLRNAFNETMIAELAAAFTQLGADAGVRAIVLAAQGPAGYSDEENRRDALALATMLRTVAECPKPVVARVHGDAYAGGVGLVAACDIVVAAQTATFCLSETKLGLIPATIGPHVVRAIGERQARRYALTAEKFDAAEAFRIGLVQELVAPDALDARVNEILGALMLTSDAAVIEAKRLVRDVAGQPLTDALLADTAQRIARVRASADGREGVASFLDKRKPRWVVEFEQQSSGSDEDEEM
jgi:methylglutaconyl-CoA hydratase